MQRLTRGKDNWGGCFFGAVLVLLVGMAAGLAVAEWINAMPAGSTQPVAADKPRAAEPTDWQLFGFILRRNLTVFVMLLLGVVSAGLVTVVVLLGNGLAIGQLIGFAGASGMSRVDVAHLLLPHGVLEMGALCVAGAVGLQGFRLAIKTSTLDRRSFRSLRLGVVLVFGLGALATAAGVEAFVTVEIAESLRRKW